MDESYFINQIKEDTLKACENFSGSEADHAPPTRASDWPIGNSSVSVGGTVKIGPDLSISSSSLPINIPTCGQTRSTMHLALIWILSITDASIVVWLGQGTHILFFSIRMIVDCHEDPLLLHNVRARRKSPRSGWTIGKLFQVNIYVRASLGDCQSGDFVA